MALISEILVILKLVCLFLIRTGLTVIYKWTELVITAIVFCVNIILRIVSWTFELIFLPARIVNAIHRERQYWALAVFIMHFLDLTLLKNLFHSLVIYGKIEIKWLPNMILTRKPDPSKETCLLGLPNIMQLERKLHRMQAEMESLEWNQKKLQERFQMAVKECNMMEMLLAELEEEHDIAIAKIENLEGKLRNQINENLRLKEIQGKGYWNSKDQNIDNDRKFDDSSYTNPPTTLPWKSGYSESEVSLQNLLMHNDTWKLDSKTRTELLKLLKPGLKSSGTKQEPISKDTVEEVSEVLDHHRGIAISQSIFSAILSLIVGMTVWEADDPCMPLVIALFAVVGMSLKSVVQFFFSIRNKPASDAVALLSFNWFILGTLTYPTLPRVAPMLAPLMLRLIDKTMVWFGLLSLV